MTEDVGPLARAVRSRRLELGLRQADLAGRGGPALATVGLIESGRERSPRPLTLGGLDRALDWKSGSAAAVLRGEDPVPFEQPPARPGLSVVGATVEPDVDEEEVDNEVLAAIRRDPDLDDDARNHFLNQYELLREMSQRRRIAAEKGEPDLLPYVAHGKRRDAVDPAEERRLEELAKQAARDNPHSPYRDRDK